MRPSRSSLAHHLETQIRTLALTLRPRTINGYRSATRGFVAYLSAAFPQLRHFTELHRDPHLLGWFRSHCDQKPPLSPKTRHNYLLCLRRLFDDLTRDGYPVPPDLIRLEDLPLQPRYLPKPLSPSEDQLLQQELQRADDLLAHALLLTRATGIRIGECIDLTADCLQPAGERQWQLHVPLGKLHTERIVPADESTHRIVARMLALRSSGPQSMPRASRLLLPCSSSRGALHQALAAKLTDAARRADCKTKVTPHRLRHTFASEMVRLGVSLPALMQMLGHKDIRMTMRYVEVTQLDLQREFHEAREKSAQPHCVPALLKPRAVTAADPAGIRQAISTARHLLEMYRRKSEDEKERRRLQRLDKRLLAVAVEIARKNTRAQK